MGKARTSLGKVQEELSELNAEIIKGMLSSENKQSRADIRKIGEAIEKTKLRMKNAQILTLDGDMEASDYKTLKIELEEHLELPKKH